MGKRKHKSKRLGARKKFKIKRKIRDHKKKVRKLAKKLAHTKRIKKDPGIPNLWPEKQKMLEQMQRRRNQNELEQQQEKLQKKHVKNQRQIFQTQQHELFQLEFENQQKLKDYRTRQDFARETEMKFSNSTSNFEKSTSKFLQDFKKVVSQSDVIIEVLDARDPLGCRCVSIEKQILSSSPDKKIILLLNKIDLVPQEVVQKWLDYLRAEYPTYPFKSSTQRQRNNLGSGKVFGNNANDAPAHVRFGGKCLGRESLIKVLKRYSMSEKVRKSITVGIIGYPNVGKSSVINSLKGKRVANVGSKPGVTNSVQIFKYDSTLQFVDCPGIIFSGKRSIDTDIILRNAVQIDRLEDTITPVDIIRKRCTNERLMKRYEIGFFKTTEEFLARIAFKTGKLLKGGKPNLQEAGKKVLRDWNEGRIPFYTLPPNRPAFNVGQQDQRQDVQWGIVDDNSVLRNIRSIGDRNMDKLIPMLSTLKL